MRILVLGDSLPFPRPKKGQPLPLTWPSLLREKLPGIDVWQRAKPRGCILDVKRELENFTESLDQFTAIVIQTGIVDCAPRPYPYFVARLLEFMLSMPTFRRVERFTHQKLLWLYRRPWISTRRFTQTLSAVIDTARAAHPQLQLLIIPIATPNRSILAMLPGIDAAALRYNQLMRDATKTLPDLIKVLDPYAGADPLSVTIEDGHHFTALGHELVAASVATALIPSSSSAIQ